MKQYIFKLTIETSKNIESLQESINNDIELYSKTNKSIYNSLFKPTTNKGN